MRGGGTEQHWILNFKGTVNGILKRYIDLTDENGEDAGRLSALLY